MVCIASRGRELGGDRLGQVDGTSARVGRAERITRSNCQSWSVWMPPDRGGVEKLPIHAQGRIFLVGADRP